MCTLILNSSYRREDYDYRNVQECTSYTLRHKSTLGTQNTNVNSVLSVKMVLKGMLNVRIRTLIACIRTHAFPML